MKNKVVEDLLNLHCEMCHGKAFNCVGCNKEEKIKGILDKHNKSVEKKNKK